MPTETTSPKLNCDGPESSRPKATEPGFLPASTPEALGEWAVRNMLPESEHARGRGIANRVAAIVRAERAAHDDLVKALRNIMNGIETGAVRIDTDQDETWANAMAQAREAIAKAECRS